MPYRPSVTRPLGPLFFLLALVFSLLVTFSNGWFRLHVVDAATASGKVSLPEFDQKTATGYVDGLRVVVMSAGLDGYHWIMNAQRMVHEKLWRVRTMPDDNFPTGRELHWSQFLLWWMALLGMLCSALSGIPIGAAIERMAPVSVAILHVFLIVALPFSIRRRAGWWAAGILAIGMSCVYRYVNLFIVGAPDHHGLVATALLCAALFLGLAGGGWVADSTSGGAGWIPERKEATRWFVASGFFVGVGLWISAATTVSMLIGVGLGVVCATGFLSGNACPGATYRASLWRVWGTVAAASSLAFYLLEYFPRHMGWRLEVNHPLYALALWGAGEVLFRLTRWRSSREPVVGTPREGLVFITALAALAAAPLTIFLARGEVFTVGDPFVWALHRDYIHEFKGFADWLALQSWSARLVVIDPLFLSVFAVARLLASRDVDAAWKTCLTIPSVAALFLTALGCYQVRWMSIADVIWLAVIVLLAMAATRARPAIFFSRWEKVLALVFVIVLCVQMPQLVARSCLACLRGVPMVNADDLDVVMARDVAYRLRALGGRRIPVVASAPTTTTWMMYFGGLRGLGTLYWENAAGLKSAAEIYSAQDDSSAAALLAQHRVDFVVMLASEPFVVEYPRLLRALPLGATPTDSLASRLSTGFDLPEWAIDVAVSSRSLSERGPATVYDVRTSPGRAVAPR